MLSSGGARTAIEGMAVLREMVSVAGDRLSVIAGSGVRPNNVERLIAATGVREVHASASLPGPMPSVKLVDYGFASGPRRETDVQTVRRLREAARRALGA